MLGTEVTFGNETVPSEATPGSKVTPGSESTPGRQSTLCIEIMPGSESTPRQHAWKLSNKGRPAAEGYLCHFAVVCNTARGAKQRQPKKMGSGKVQGRLLQQNGIGTINNSRHARFYNRAVNLFNVLVQYR